MNYQINMNRLVKAGGLLLLTLLAACSEVQKEYYDSGEIRKECQLRDGKIHGTCIEYYENGEVKVVANYVNGSLEGPIERFYPSGTIEWRGQYEDNLLHGLYSSYSESGRLIQKGHYMRGKPHGTITDYCQESGQVTAEFNYVKGEEHGFYRSYYDNGRLELEAIRSNDSTTVFYREFDEQGNVVDESYYIAIHLKSDTFQIGDNIEVSIDIQGPITEEFVLKAAVLERLAARETDYRIVPISSEGKATFSYVAKDTSERYVWVTMNSGFTDSWFVEYKKIKVIPRKD